MDRSEGCCPREAAGRVSDGPPGLRPAVSATDVRAKHAEIERRYAWHNRQHGGRPSITTLRIAQLERLATSRYGTVLPDNDTGRAFVRIAINHLSEFATAKLRIASWLRRWAPWCGDRRPERRMWKADTLARVLNVTAEERWRLELWTIGAIDCSKAQRARLRREKAAVRERNRRAAKKQSACAV